jgi:hypothetical protein
MVGQSSTGIRWGYDDVRAAHVTKETRSRRREEGIGEIGRPTSNATCEAQVDGLGSNLDMHQALLRVKSKSQPKNGRDGIGSVETMSVGYLGI